MSLRRHLPTAALCSATVILSVAGGATAAGLITGADIKNGTVTTADLKNKDVRATDLAADAVNAAKVKDRSLSGNDVSTDTLTGVEINEETLDLSEFLPGEPTLYRWEQPYTYESNGGDITTINVTSQVNLPADSTVTAHRFTNTSSCDNTSLNTNLVGGSTLASASNGYEDLQWANTGSTAKQIRVNGFDFQGRACTGTFELVFAVQPNPTGEMVPFG